MKKSIDFTAWNFVERWAINNKAILRNESAAQVPELPMNETVLLNMAESLEPVGLRRSPRNRATHLATDCLARFFRDWLPTR